MQPRVLFRTHYQVDEPAFAEVVVLRCSSPVASSYDENVAEKLARDIQGRRKGFNIAAANYAVDLAHGLHLINANNAWAENGHLTNLVASVSDGPWEDELPLTRQEQLLHFRLFIEADGAAMLFLSRLLLTENQLPVSGSDWNALAKTLFIETYSEYLAVTNPIAERVALRSELDRLRRSAYNGKSGAHKLFLHLQTLYRIGLIEKVSTSAGRQYRITEEGRLCLERLLREVPDVIALEEIVRGHRYIEVAAQVYKGNASEAELDSDTVLIELLPAYLRMSSTGVAICPLAPLIEATQISLLTTREQIIAYSRILELLTTAQRSNLSEIRFHQNRQGEPAFLKLSETLLERLGSQVAPNR